MVLHRGKGSFDEGEDGGGCCQSKGSRTCGCLLWTIFYIIGFAIISFQVGGCIQKYLTYPKKGSIHQQGLNELAFPWVSVCNVNHLDPLVVDQIQSILNQEDVLDSTFVDEYEKYQQSGAIFVEALTALTPLDWYPADAFGLYSRYGLTANLGVNLASQAGVKLSDFVYNCQFKNSQCNITESFLNFFDPYYYNCYTFNTESDTIDWTSTGPRNGLILDVFLGSAGTIESDGEYAIPGMEESTFPPTSGPGVKVVVHPPNTPPYPTDEGYTIPIGFGATLGVGISMSERMPPPYGDCAEASASQSTHDYTTSACLKECMQLYIIQQCACIDSRLSSDFLQNQDGMPFCYQLPESAEEECSTNPDSPPAGCEQLVTTWNSVSTCVENVYSNSDTLHCGCPTPCSETKYQTTYSLNKLPDNPGNAFDNFLQGMDPAKKEILHRDYGDNLGNMTSRVHVYLQDSVVTVYQQEAAYPLVDLCSDIGIQLILAMLLILMTILYCRRRG